MRPILRITTMPGKGVVHIPAPGKSGGRTRPRGVFPFRFGRKSSPEAPSISIRFGPRDIFYRQVQPLETGRIFARNTLKLFLGNFMNHQVIRIEANLVFRFFDHELLASHGEAVRFDF